MTFLPTTSGAPITELAADVFASRRRLQSAAQDVREWLPLSARFDLDHFLSLPPDRLLSAVELASAADLISKLRDTVAQVGGAPVVEHTEEGELFTVGGTEAGRQLQIVLDHLAELLRQAWLVSDRLAAEAAIETLQGTLATRNGGQPSG